MNLLWGVKDFNRVSYILTILMEDTFSLISNLQAEMNRLQYQAEELSPLTSESIKKSGILEGMTVTDVGCGTGHVSFLLSKVVGKGGKVIGIDVNPAAIEFCRKRAQTNEVKNVSFMIGNAQDLSADISDGSIDAVYSRFLLTHLKDPRKVIKEMLRITRRQGIIMIEDCDLTHWIVEPDNKFVNILWKWYSSIIKKKGGNPSLGRKLYKMFIQQGLDPRIDVYSLPVTTANSKIWNSIIDVLNKIDEMKNFEEVLDIDGNSVLRPHRRHHTVKLHDLIDGLVSFSKNESSLFIFPLIYRVWAIRS
jgi:ubiquinone/menaquinone biosynthesis C-methylase UbiE